MLAMRLGELGITGNYMGIDIGNRFAATSMPHLKVNFLQIDAHQYVPEPQSVDLIISVSALEHTDNNVVLIRKFSEFMRPGGVQVQVVPAGASLACYLWHGYRQYTPMMLAERFPAAKLVRLTGLGSFALHVFAVMPEMVVRYSLRTAAPATYGKLLRLALRIDRLLPVCPTAFVVINQH